MFTISRLAKQLNVSRTTILYYEKMGLLRPSKIGENGYRYYDNSKIHALKSILSYRQFGLSVKAIRPLIEQMDSAAHFTVLHQQFSAISQQIAHLRTQQYAIIKRLQQPQLLRQSQFSKQQWVALLVEMGFSEEDMMHWHRDFEQRDPMGHHSFLTALSIDANEIEKIRSLSR